MEQDRYKINLDIWREKQNATNSEGSSVEVASNNRTNDGVRDTQELFEEYCRQRRKLQEREKLKQQLQEAREKRQQREQELKEQEEKRLQAEKEQETDLEIIYNVDDEVALINATPPISQPLASRDNTDDVLLMSPLLVVSDSEDPDDVPQICNDPNDDTDIVDLSTDEESEKECTEVQTNETCKEDEKVPEVNGTTPKVDTKRKTHSREADRLRADVATNLKYQNETTPKRRTRHEEVQRLTSTRRRGSPILESNRPKDVAKSNKIRKNVTNDTVEDRNKAKKDDQQVTKRCTKDSKSDCSKTTDTSKNKDKQVQEKDKPQNEKPTPATQSTKVVEKASGKTKVTNTSENITNTGNSSTSRPSRSSSKHATSKDVTTTNEKESQLQSTNNSEVATNNVSDVVIKIEPDEATAVTHTRRTDMKMVRLERIKRELDLDHVPLHNKETRSMQRSTRSNACNSKYSFNNLSLHNEKSTPKSKKKLQEKNKCPLKQNPQGGNKSKSGKDVSDTQAPVISMTCSQDYDPIQCAQRLSDVAAVDSSTQRSSPQFLVPPTPPINTRNSLIPSSFTSSNGFFADSEVLFVPPSAPKGGSNTNSGKKQTEDVIILSGSETENSSSMQMSSTSRRTRALKPRRVQNPQEEAGKVPTFSQLLAQHNTRKSTKSPDLFSNCSDIGQLTLSQPPVNAEDEPNTPFEGFKIFGSEVKQLQQHYAMSKTQNPVNKNKNAYRDRSCLDILENMFEPTNKKLKPKDNTVITTTNETAVGKHTQLKRSTQRTQKPIVPQHPIEAIAEAKAQQELKEKRSQALSLNEDEIFEITNNGTFGSVMRLHSNGEISPVQQTQKSTKTPNKITKYFVGGLTQNLTGSQEDSGNNSESGTPSKKQQIGQTQHQQISNTQYANSKKSPRQKYSSTQVTKLTKWFTKNSPNKQQSVQEANTSVNAKQTAVGKRQVKRRRLDLTQVTDDA